MIRLSPRSRMATKELHPELMDAKNDAKNTDPKKNGKPANGDYTADSIKVLGGMEAVRKIRVENMPAFIITDDKGNDFFDEYNK